MTCNALCMNYFECITCYRRDGQDCRCGNDTEIPVIFINSTLSVNYEIDGILTPHYYDINIVVLYIVSTTTSQTIYRKFN